MKTPVIKSLKDNITIGIVADKNHQPLPEAVSNSFDKVSGAIATLNDVDIPEIHKTARLAEVAEREYNAITDQLDAYEAEFNASVSDFHTMVDDMSKPKTTMEAVQQSGWQAALVQSGKDAARKLSRSDPLLAAAALQLPKALAETVGLGNTGLLKEVIQEGYLAEVAKHDTVRDNLTTARQHYTDQLKPLFNSPKARKATADVKSIGAL